MVKAMPPAGIGRRRGRAAPMPPAGPKWRAWGAPVPSAIDPGRAEQTRRMGAREIGGERFDSKLTKRRLTCIYWHLTEHSTTWCQWRGLGL